MTARLELPIHLPRAWDTAAAALAACARSLGDSREVVELMAASGLAFRIGVDAHITPAGPHAFPWREELTLAAERLGCRWRLVAAANGDPLFADACERAFELAIEGVRAGRPTLLFGVHTAEFGLARGFDPGEGALLVSGSLDGLGASDRLPRSSLGREAGLVFALQLVERVETDAAAVVRATLRAAVEHARGRGATVGGMATGLSAWEAMARAVETNRVISAGLAYAAQRYAEARDAAARFVAAARPHLAADAAAAEQAGRALRRAAAMLAELARLLPFPPSSTEMLTTTRREQALELLRETARAEEEAVATLEHALAAEAVHERSRGLMIHALDRDRLPSLFACVDEIPVAGLRDEAVECRDRLAPQLGAGFSGRLLYRDQRLIGHLLWAPLDAARYPVTATGKRWFVFCPWLAREERGSGVGGRLFAAVEAAARAEGVDGLLTVATSIEVFLHHRGYERYGFVEVDRRGDSRLLERQLRSAPSGARFLDPPPDAGTHEGGALPVVVRHAYNCPLLLRVRRGAAEAARSFAAGVAVDEGEATTAEPCGIRIGGREVAHGPVPPEAIAAGVVAEREAWRR